MLLNTKDMMGVSVVTRLGQAVGKVTSFDLDAVTGRMMRLHVKTGGLVSGLLQSELCVAASSVISMSLESVVIADAAVSAEEHVSATNLNPASTMSGLLGKE